MEVDLGITHLEIGNGYAIARTRAGADVSLADHNLVMETIAKHTKVPFVLVIDEINTYSVKLETLMSLRTEKRFSHWGVISYRPQTRIVHTLGSRMARRPVSFFSSRDEAIKWAESMCIDEGVT